MFKSFKSYFIATLVVFILLQSVVCFADFPSGFFPILSSGDLYQGQDMSVASSDMNQKILRSIANDKARLESIQAQPKTSYVLIKDGAVTVVYDFGSQTELFGVTLRKRGINQIFDYDEFFTVDKSLELNHTSILNKKFKRTSVTDTHSPYIVTALYNADGDKKEFYNFTGGNHSYDDNNGNVGSNTGSTQSVYFIVDGLQVDSYDGYASQVEIIYENYIMASNTIKMFTQGRNVIREVNRLKFDGKKWNSSINVTAFEPVNIYRYYGLQFDTRYFGENLMYVYGDGRISLYDTGIDTASSDKTCNIMNVFGEKFDVEVGISSDFGEYNETSYSAFSEDYNKIYFNVVNSSYGPLYLNQGESFTLEGYYKFTSSK